MANVTAIGDTNDTILGLATTCRDFILFEWDLKPYDRKSSLYKRVLFVCVLTNRAFPVSIRMDLFRMYGKF